jgi:hypothetical protein
MFDGDGAFLHALTLGAAQDALNADGLIEKIGTGLALETDEAIEVKDVGRAQRT